MSDLSVTSSTDICVAGDDLDVMSVPGDGGDEATPRADAKPAAPVDTAETTADTPPELSGRDARLQFEVAGVKFGGGGTDSTSRSVTNGKTTSRGSSETFNHAPHPGWEQDCDRVSDEALAVCLSE